MVGVLEIEGLRSKSKLYHVGDGYFYIFNRIKGYKVFLKCRDKLCTARASMALQIKSRQSIHCNGNHNHKPDLTLIPVLNLRRDILCRCQEEKSDSRTIFDEECAKVPPEVSSRVSFKTMRSNMYKSKRVGINSILMSELAAELELSSNECHEIAQAAQFIQEAVMEDERSTVMDVVQIPAQGVDHNSEATADSSGVHFASATVGVQEIEGLRSRSKLYHVGNGYFYVYNRVKGHRVFLKCRNKLCRVRASMALEIEARKSVDSNGHHNHKPDRAFTKVLHLKREILRRCQEEISDSRTIFDEECAKVELEVSSRLSYESMRSSMYKAKRAGGESIPSTLPELELPRNKCFEEAQLVGAENAVDPAENAVDPAENAVDTAEILAKEAQLVQDVAMEVDVGGSIEEFHIAVAAVAQSSGVQMIVEQDHLECLICSGNEKLLLADPCGHIFICQTCERRLQHYPVEGKKCFLCRTPVIKFILVLL